MKQFWPIVYVSSIPFCIYGGFAAMRHSSNTTNIDWVLIAIVLVMMTSLPLGLFAYGINYSKKEKMERPSLDRHCFGWWTDTLQPLRVSVLGTAFYTLGTLAAYPGAAEQARMLIFLYVATTIGITIGERLVYSIYDSKIVQREATASH
jgi:hypothetical protein